MKWFLNSLTVILASTLMLCSISVFASENEIQQDLQSAQSPAIGWGGGGGNFGHLAPDDESIDDHISVFDDPSDEDFSNLDSSSESLDTQ